ncbi:MAG: hypothetical protein ACYCW5_06330 [Thermoleophilia bacterium]
MAGKIPVGGILPETAAEDKHPAGGRQGRPRHLILMMYETDFAGWRRIAARLVLLKDGRAIRRRQGHPQVATERSWSNRGFFFVHRNIMMPSLIEL